MARDHRRAPCRGRPDDPRFLAEHRSAVADVALLREQLRLMGDTLASATPAARDTAAETPATASTAAGQAPGPGLGPFRTPRTAQAPTPARPSRTPWYRRYAGVALGTLVVAGVTALLGGMVLARGRAAAPTAEAAGDSAASKQEAGGGRLGLLARCTSRARGPVEGTVAGVERSAATETYASPLNVKRYYKPEQSGRTSDDHRHVLGSAREDLKVGTYRWSGSPVYPRPAGLGDRLGRRRRP